MNLARFFVDRPIFAAVLSLAITLLGGLAYLGLPVAQYPDVVPPTVVVTANYPGADARTLAEVVATPLEQEINGVENMLYLSSSATSDGRVQITVTFRLGTDLDQAQVLVQNRVNAAVARLPEDVRRFGVTAQKRSPDLTLSAQFYSPDGSRDVTYLANYVTLQIQNEIARIPGVAEASMLGGLDYSMRLWLDPERVASYGLTAGDVLRAVREQNLQVAAGSLGQQPAPAGAEFQYTLVAQGRLQSPEQFADIVLRAGANGEVVRLRDVARVELGSRDYSVRTYMDGKNAVSLRVFQLPGSNAIETADLVYAALERLKERFPPGVGYRINYDTTRFVRATLRSVLGTLVEAILLVVLVVVIFLQTWRSSLIPLLAVPVSLVGTLAVMAWFGFTLNNLSLFGLVLAIGIVVDDAIVVVENVERQIALGHAPREATLLAMREVSGPIVAVALVLGAVFVPTAFLGGITGQFYRQFALTIAVSTFISAFNSLTLSPALCALLLRPHHAPPDFVSRILERLAGGFFRLFNRAFRGAANLYGRIATRALRLAALMLVLYAGLVAGGIGLFQHVPRGFIPVQDMGYCLVVVQLPDGASLERTDAVVRRMDALAREIPGIAHTFAISGYSSVLQANQPNVGAAFLILDDFPLRRDPALRGDALLASIRRKFSVIQEGRVLVLPPPPLRGLGSAGGFKIQVQDLDNAGLDALDAATRQLLDALQHEPGFTSLITGFRPHVPQYRVHLDRAQAKSMGLSLADVNEALQVFLGSAYVNDFNLFGRTYQVTAQAAPEFRGQPEDVARIKIRNARGDMVPLGTIARIERVPGADRVQRYNLYYSADVSGSTAPGISSGQVIRRVEELARTNLPRGFGIEWTDLMFQQILAGNTIVFLFPLSVVFVFLVLSALYESWSLPLAIILIVPLCLLSAVGGVWLRGQDNNIFTQIGLIVLVGLAAKNAILLVEFARQREDAGLDRFAAALEACRLRLRPILMTSLAFILGVIPLLVARGAGAEMRQTLGTAVFFGMIGVTVFGLLLTPVFYVVIRRFGATRRQLARAAAAAAAAAIVSGCAVGPRHRPPSAPLPAAFSDPATPAAAQSPSPRWWQDFHDARLDALVALASTNAPDLRLAIARLREARALWREARLDYLPTVTSDAAYQQTQLSAANARPGAGAAQRHFELYSVGLDATWELDLFGRVRRSVEAARGTVEALDAERADVLVSLQAEVVAQYLTLRGIQAQTDAVRHNATNQAENLALAERLRDGGRATQFDVARARSQWVSTLAAVPPLEAAADRAIHRLGVLCGRPPREFADDLLPAAPLPRLANVPGPSEPASLLRRRPDLRAVERHLAAATARVGVATADLFPRVTFHGDLGLEAARLSRFDQPGTEAWGFGPRITWPALNLGRVRARLRAADARAEAALAAYERTVLLALEETENALTQLRQTRTRLAHLHDAAASAREALDLARRRFQDGIADYLAVLDAERSVLGLDLAIASAETDHALSLVALAKSLGGGWESTPAP